MIMKHIPNSLSALRIPLSLGLLFLAKWPWVFTALYLVIGLTDVLDGRIARHYHVESKLGAKLDGLGDAVFFLTAAASLAFFARLEIEPLKCLAAMGAGMAHKAANLLVTRVRFKQWNSIHTLMSKSLGVAVYFAVPVFLLLGKANFYMVLGISVMLSLVCIEETVTLLRLAEYDVNSKGVVGEKIAGWLPKRGAA